MKPRTFVRWRLARRAPAAIIWRRLEDDFRTLIASGFEFPAIDLPLSTDSITAREDVRYLPDIQGHKGLVQPDRSAPTAIEMLDTSGDAVNGVEASPVASCAETEFKAVERGDGEDTCTITAASVRGVTRFLICQKPN